MIGGDLDGCGQKKRKKKTHISYAFAARDLDCYWKRGINILHVGQHITSYIKKKYVLFELCIQVHVIYMLHVRVVD